MKNNHNQKAAPQTQGASRVVLQRGVRPPTTQTGNGSEADEGQGNGLNLIPGYEGRHGFAKWLRTLELGGCMFHLEARTDHDAQLYATALSQWKDAGYPDPGGWPDNPRIRQSFSMSSYTRQWVERWSNDPKLRHGAPPTKKGENEN